MLRLAEESRMVGGDQIDQFLDFIRALRGVENAAVFVVGGKPRARRRFRSRLASIVCLSGPKRMRLCS